MNDIGYATDAYIGELARLGRTRATRRKYQEVLWQLATHIGDKDLDQVTTADLRSFLDRWVNASPSTVALYVSILRGFFQFLVDETALTESPMATIRRPPRKRPEDLDVVTVSTDDVSRMFAACQEWDELLCIALLAYLGPRRGATARLRRRDVDLERGLIRFQEKGGKIIAKPIPDELAEILRAADGEGLWVGPDDYVIPNRRAPRNRERSDKVVYKLVTEIAARARVRSHVHALRAAFAVRYLDTNPGDLDALQKLLGHSRVETTQVYLRRQDRFRAMERVRSLSWGGSVLPPNAQVPPAGFEPALPPDRLPEPLRWKLEELRARSTRRARGRAR
jgi:integrase/recombinase XerD